MIWLNVIIVWIVVVVVVQQMTVVSAFLSVSWFCTSTVV